MKKWQKQALKLGLPILLDWIKSWWSKDVSKDVQYLEGLAEDYLKAGNYDKYSEVKRTIRGLKNE